MIIPTKPLPKIQHYAKTFTKKNDSLYEQAAKIGNKDCSDTYKTGLCANLLCCKNIYGGSNTDTHDKWLALEKLNKETRKYILKDIDDHHESRTAFIKKIDQEIEELSKIYEKAYWDYQYNGAATTYKKICGLIDHKHLCLLNQLELVESDNSNLWQQCQAFTFKQLQQNPIALQNFLDVYFICEQKPVLAKRYAIVEAKVQLARALSKATGTKIE